MDYSGYAWDLVRAKAEAFARDLDRTQQALADCSGNAAVGQQRLEECEARVRTLQAERQTLSAAMERSTRCDARMEVYQAQLQTLRQQYTDLADSLNAVVMPRVAPGASPIAALPPTPAAAAAAVAGLPAAPAAAATLAAAAATEPAALALGAIRW